MPDRPNQVKVGFRTSIIGLFVSVVLMVGLSLVYLSFDRATSIIRSAASTFVDNVAEHAASSLDTQFKDVHDSIELLTILPSVQQGRIDDPATYTLMAATLRGREQLFNLYTGYDDGTFLELDFIDRAGGAFRDTQHAPADAVFRLFLISSTGAGGERAAKVIFLSQTLAP